MNYLKLKLSEALADLHKRFGYACVREDYEEASSIVAAMEHVTRSLVILFGKEGKE